MYSRSRSETDMTRSVAPAVKSAHGRSDAGPAYGQLAGTGASFAVNDLAASNFTVPPKTAQ